MRLRVCLLEELQPSTGGSNGTENGLTYDEHLHSSMQTFWDLFITGIYTQEITCTRCNTISTTEEPFSKLMLKFPQSHHESDHKCTLEELISHHNAPEDIQQYRCDYCNMPTCVTGHSIISQYPKVLCIVLSRKKSNDTILKLAVQYPLHGLFGTVHHNVNRGKSGHYIAIFEHQDSNSWFSYDDENVYRVRFVNRRNGNMLTDFMKSAAVLFYVNYTAVPVHSSNLCTHNGNNETQSLVDTDNDVSSSSSTVSSSSSNQRQNKSTDETAQAASICMQKQNDSSNNPAPPKS
jgi:ubiquitin C-terminal hydrolase